MQKNFLFIVADQFRADAIGAAEKYKISTPNLDRLAAEGVRFTQAYTPLPVCAPARQAMFTGKNPDSTGAFWNYGFFSATSLCPGDYWSGALSDAGYDTVFVGKWNVSQNYKPTDLGYNEYISNDEYNRMKKEKYPDVTRPDWFGATSPIPLEDSKTHWLASRVCEKIERFAHSGRPWHIHLAYTEPHLPNEPSEPFASMYDPDEILPWDGVGDSLEGKPYIQRQQLRSWGIESLTWDDWKASVARYYAMVSQIDDSIGIILKALERTGQLENTVIVFTADHGDMCGSRGMLDKHYVLYDDVVRIPFIVRGAGQGVCDDMISLIDLAPSVEDLFGLEVHTDYHGRSFRPLLDGEPPADWRKEVLSSSNGQQFGFYNQRMLRDKEYKYIWNLTDIDELYDLRNDPAEKINLAQSPEYSEVLNGMRRRLYVLLKQQDDPFVGSGWLDRQLLEGRQE